MPLRKRDRESICTSVEFTESPSIGCTGHLAQDGSLRSYQAGPGTTDAAPWYETYAVWDGRDYTWEGPPQPLSRQLEGSR